MFLVRRANTRTRTMRRLTFGSVCRPCRRTSLVRWQAPSAVGYTFWVTAASRPTFQICSITTIRLLSNGLSDGVPTQRHFVASGGVLDGKFVVAGGLDGSNRMNSSVEIYDPTMDTWHFGSSMPFPTRSAATASKGTRLYVVGGLDNPGSTNLQGLDRVLRYDLTTDEWSVLTWLPDTRQGAQAAILGNSLFVLGGSLFNNNGRPTPTVVLDLAAFP